MENLITDERKSLNPQETAIFISAGGNLQRNSVFFEERESQVKLLKDICNVFNSDGIGVFEAGTGVGKSFAYLIPAMLWALQNNQRVVISTGTINLQQQLIEKDIPLAQKIIEKSIKAVLVKGRQNFICKRRLNEAIQEPDLFTDDEDELNKIFLWSKTSETGSKNDLSFLPSESNWQRVNSESDACFGMRCPFHETCFVMKVRKEAADAQLLIVNHHLLFADVEARANGVGYDDTAVLPPFKRLILDEAHGIENAATSFFSESLTRFRFTKQLNVLYRMKRGASAGLLYTLETLSSKGDSLGEIVASITTIKGLLQDLEEAALDFLDNDYSIRLITQTSPRAENMLHYMKKMQQEISDFTGAIRELIEGIPEDNREIPAVWETKQVLRRIDAVGLFCKGFSEWTENPKTIFWIEKNRLPVNIDKREGSNATIYPRFVQTPLEIANKMNSDLFEQMESVVCTSATLRIDTSFGYWMSRSGITLCDSERVVTGEYPSPFPYDRNLLLLITADAPLPDNLYFQDYIEKAIPKLISAAEGRTLVLFTSYESLRKACEVSRNNSSLSGIKILKQGDDDRFRLLESFKNDKSSVLFATDSFWEGVDVPGESLSQVIIIKLPFKVPGDPIFSARSESIEQRGGSSFMELSVPDAVIRFRQGFGRLLRRSTDRGIVTVLDRRIYEKRYGRVFISSIPKTKTKIISLNDCVTEIDRFLSEC